MRHAHALPLAALTLVSGCSQPLLSMQLEIPDIRITVRNIMFNTTLPAYYCSGVPGCVENQVAYDIGAEVPALNEKGVSFDLRLTDLALTLTSGDVTDLSSIKSARVKVQDPANPSNWIVIASYTKKPGAAPPTISVAGNPNIDLSPYIASGKLTVRIEADYDLANPPGIFYADVEAGFSLVVTQDYDAYM